jgi:hypothetical protein
MSDASNRQSAAATLADCVIINPGHSVCQRIGPEVIRGDI